jgi:hypothetical protein
MADLLTAHGGEVHRDRRGPDTAGVGKPSVVSAAAQADRTLAEFWTSYVGAQGGGIRYVVRNPLQSLRALRDIRNLHVVRALPPSGQPGGRAVREVLELRGPFGVPARWWGSAVLAVPADPSEHVEGPHAQTLRRKMRAAERRGFTCRPVQRAERIDLLARANLVEQTHHDEQYRVHCPHNDDLLAHDLWMVAEDHAGEPLLLTVIPVDGELATLRYFRTLGVGESHTLGRYLATHALVVELSRRGVRWLLDTAPPGAQTNGVRHFQRMVGFRYMRVRVGSGARRFDHIGTQAAP